MTEENKMSKAIDEVKNASEEELQEVIEKWFESTRTDGMRLGAYYISAAVMGAINKNLKNGMGSSHRDFERAIKRVVEIVSVQLTQQNDSEEVDTDEAVEEVANDGTAE